MKFTATLIAQLIGGTVEGNENAVVTSFAKIEEAKASEITFLSNLNYEEHLYKTEASIVIISNDYQLKQPVNTTLIRVQEPYPAFITLLTKYQEMMDQQMTGIEEPSHISSLAQLGEQVFVGAFAYIGDHSKIGNNTKIYPNAYIGSNVTIGDNVVIHPGVKIYRGCVVKNNVVLHAGTVIGADGFGYVPTPEGSLKKVPQIGNVVIEDNVEIGANTTIDRATMGSTIIRAGAKIDNLVQVGHNCEVGNNTVIAAQVGISGSTKIGKWVMIGGQAGFADHIEVADFVKVGGQAGVTKSVKTPKAAINSNPAFDAAKALRCHAVYKNLPELEKRVQKLERGE